jgi:UPF0755 protein
MKFNRKILKITSIFFIVLFSIVLYFIYDVIYNPALKLKTDKYIYLNSENDIYRLEKTLISDCGLKHPYLFRKLAKKMNLNKWIKQGRYSLKPKMTLIDVIKTFRDGKLKTVDLTIKSLSDLETFSEMCGNRLEPDDTSFLNIFNHWQLLDSLGFNKATIYAMILPDTYNFYWHTSPSELLLRLKKEYDKYWNSERLKKCELIGLTPIEINILASIVSKETNKRDEMPLVAGMYINRLNIKMPLQADPTIKFALNQPGLKRILNIHLQVESPYNTYQNIGLPPGPICIASKESIEAVLNYQKSDYIFMCAKEDFSGYHAFAKDYETHLKNARRYQQALNIRNIK